MQMISSKERVIYILKILVLIKYFRVVVIIQMKKIMLRIIMLKIEALEAKVDSLHTINDDLSVKN